LLREQFVVRTPRGRVATARAFHLLGRTMRRPPDALGPSLFGDLN
jgi:Holliday junction DNA helicase RuvB